MVSNLSRNKEFTTIDKKLLCEIKNLSKYFIGCHTTRKIGTYKMFFIF